MKIRCYISLLLALFAVRTSWSQTGIPDLDNPYFHTDTRLVEIAPFVTGIELKMGDPFIEVFISGMAATDCFDLREYQVEKSDTLTRIIPRFKRSKPDATCSKTIKPFHEKAADLDPNSPASHRVDVLGYQGWHTEFFKAAL